MRSCTSSLCSTGGELLYLDRKIFDSIASLALYMSVNLHPLIEKLIEEERRRARQHSVSNIMEVMMAVIPGPYAMDGSDPRSDGEPTTRSTSSRREALKSTTTCNIIIIDPMQKKMQNMKRLEHCGGDDQLDEETEEQLYCRYWHFYMGKHQSRFAGCLQTC